MSTGNTTAIQYNRNFCAFKYIRCTCYDLNGLCSDIYLADNQLVCIWMWLDLYDLTNHDLIQIGIQFFISFCF